MAIEHLKMRNQEYPIQTKALILGIRHLLG